MRLNLCFDDALSIRTHISNYTRRMYADKKIRDTVRVNERSVTLKNSKCRKNYLCIV